MNLTWAGWPRGRAGGAARRRPLVALAAERAGKGIGRIRLARLADASANSLRTFVEASVTPGSRVPTDGWEAYGGLPAWGYLPPAKVLRGQGPDAATRLLPRGPRVAALLKRWLLGTHQGCGAPRSLGLLPRRVHLPVQSPDFGLARQTFLPTGAAGRGAAASSLQATQRWEPQPIGPG